MVATEASAVRQEIDEARREAMRRDPDVRVRRRKTLGPFVSPIRLAGPVDVREIIGRCDGDDEPADRQE